MKAISEDESQNENLRGKKTNNSKEEIVDEEAAAAEMSDDSVHTTDMSSDEEENKVTANDIKVNNLKDSTDVSNFSP